MGVWSKFQDSVAERGLAGTFGRIIRREYGSISDGVNATSESEVRERPTKLNVRVLDDLQIQEYEKDLSANHSQATDLNNMAFMQKTEGLAKTYLNKIMSLSVLKEPFNPKDDVIKRIDLTSVEGFDADIDIVDSEYEYVQNRSKDLALDIPENSDVFERLNQALFNPEDLLYKDMSKAIDRLDKSNERLVIESAPYTRSEKLQGQITPTRKEYEGASLRLVQQLAEDSMRQRGARSTDIGDYTYAHMRYLELEKKDKELLDYMERTIEEPKGMSLDPKKPQTEEHMIESFEESKQSVLDFGPTWAERNEQYKRDNPEYVERMNTELQPEYEDDLEMV